ncbi:serine/threonine-protein kinase [Mycobacterium marinum]|uniref:serine/threonine-protein kinase n=1 Tax=Mycobacterium marinum TaxID=1781 RepID=UPI000B977C1E|nr:serine/threonine-protein kinase [Mycobacterium marinum]
MTGATSTPGRIIAGRYEVRRALGSGAFGEVYEVFDHNLKQVCALKIHNQLVAGPWTEAQILRQLDGEYILKVLNADLAAGAPYVVTHLATNGTVADQIGPGIGIPITAAVRWARQACQGVARIHDQNLLHRDVKPENLFIDKRQDVLVGDLGLAQLQDGNGLADAAGSIPTMAPEIARVGVPGQNAATARVYSVAADVFSLGATLFWMLAGMQPVPGASSYGDVWAATQPDLWDVAPHVPQGLRDIVNKSIAREPVNRYSSAAKFDSALGGWSPPLRRWTRVKPHPGHEQCFSGAKGASLLEVCAIPTGIRTQLNIVACHSASRRAVTKARRTVPRSGLSAGLRSAFHACN